jgi:hypothetical protein
MSFCTTSFDTSAWKLVPFSLFTYPVINIKICHNLFFFQDLLQQADEGLIRVLLSGLCWPGSVLVTAATKSNDTQLWYCHLMCYVSVLVKSHWAPLFFVIAHTREWCFQIVTVRVVAVKYHNRKEGQNDQRCTAAAGGRETPWTTRYIERNNWKSYLY